MKEPFVFVGVRTENPTRRTHAPQRSLPHLSVLILSLILFICLFAELFMTKDPSYLDLAHCNEAPNVEFFFGTDSLGRDIFSGIWYGGRISLTIGFFATALSTAIALFYGTLSGLAPSWADGLMMRLVDLLLSVPTLLPVLFLQSILGQANVLSLSVVIGLTGWMSLARLIRTEIRLLRNREYILASRCMGAGFFHLLRRHYIPNLIAPTMFIVVMNVRSAIVTESTLSFLGMGLPLEVISWGSMLSLAQNALLSGNWWIVLIPGAFLLTLLMCLTNVGNDLRKNANRRQRRL